MNACILTPGVQVQGIQSEGEGPRQGGGKNKTMVCTSKRSSCAADHCCLLGQRVFSEEATGPAMGQSSPLGSTYPTLEVHYQLFW